VTAVENREIKCLLPSKNRTTSSVHPIILVFKMKTTVDLKFDIASDVLSLGLTGSYFTMNNLRNQHSNDDFELFKSEIQSEIFADLSIEGIEEDPVLKGFRHLHESVGFSGKKNISSPENLLLMFLRQRKIPTINLLVDIYNLVSLETRLAIGAHDIANISGNVHLRLTNGTEGFWPIGYDKPQGINAGQYAYVDDNNDILCRLEARQVEKTKVTLDTTNCFFIIQGNPATTGEYIDKATHRLVSLIKQFCGGTEDMLYSPA
jgi:DNA/RNA-binding domain of Phe-tRNA-synthetase-like protein